MNKKLIITGAVLVVISGCLIKVIASNTKTGHTSKKYEYYYNDINASEIPSISPSDETPTQTMKDVPLDIEPESLTCLVNKEYPLPSDYIPNDLVLPNIDFNISYYAEKKLLRNDAAVAIEKLFEAAKDEGLSLYGVSGYRSYKRQEEIYNNNIKTKGTAHTNKYSAKPGYSEHQTGLSMDVSTPSISYQLIENFGQTDEGQWLAQNCFIYGFIIRFPEHKEHITGYAYEPWHIRYVGIELATYLTRNSLTLEEYYNAIPSEDDISDEDDETIVDIEDNSTSSLAPTLPSQRPSDPTNIEPSKEPIPSLESTPSAKPTSSTNPSRKPSKKPVASQKPVSTEKPIPSDDNVIPSEVPSHSNAPTEKPSKEPSQEPANTPEPTQEHPQTTEPVNSQDPDVNTSQVVTSNNTNE